MQQLKHVHLVDMENCMQVVGQKYMVKIFSVEGYFKYQEILYSRGYLTALCLLEKYGKLSCFILTSSFWLAQLFQQK